MRDDEVMKWSGTALGRLRFLTVFNELPGSTGSKSSGLIKASEPRSCAVSDKGLFSMLAGAELVWRSAGDKINRNNIIFNWVTLALMTWIHVWFNSLDLRGNYCIKMWMCSIVILEKQAHFKGYKNWTAPLWLHWYITIHLTDHSL